MLLQISWLDASWTRKLEFLDNDLWDFISLWSRGKWDYGTIFYQRGDGEDGDHLIFCQRIMRGGRGSSTRRIIGHRIVLMDCEYYENFERRDKIHKSKNDVDKGGRWSGDDLCAGQAGLGGSSATLSSHPYHTHHYTPYLFSLPYPPLHTILTLLTIPTITVYHTYPPSYPPLHTYPHYHIQV